METKTNRELTEQLQSLETYTKTYLPKQLKDTDAKIPDTTSEDAGKFIGVDSNGDLAVVEAVNSLPAVTSASDGFSMKVVGEQWAAVGFNTQGTVTLTISDGIVSITGSINATQLHQSVLFHREKINNIALTVDDIAYTAKVNFKLTPYYKGNPATDYAYMLSSDTLRVSDDIFGKIVIYIDRATSANNKFLFIKEVDLSE